MAVEKDSQTTKTREESPVEPSDESKVSPLEVQRALSDAGRKQQEAERLLAEARKERQEVDRLRQEQEKQELERYSDDPEGLEVVKTRQRQRVKDEELRRREEDLILRESTQKEIDSKNKDAALKTSAATIAAKYHGVTVEDLISFTDGTPERMETLAKKLVSGGTTKPPLRINSGLSSGGSNLDIKELRKQFIANPYDPEIREAINKYDREQQLKNRY